MSMKRRDWLRRFILLIDTLYYMHINVVIEASHPLEELFDMEEESDRGFNAATRTKGGVDIHMLEDLQGMEDRTSNEK
jgi:predicted ATPase